MSAGARDGSPSRSIRPATPVPAARRAELLAQPGFGQVFTDHMVTIDLDGGARLA